MRRSGAAQRRRGIIPLQRFCVRPPGPFADLAAQRLVQPVDTLPAVSVGERHYARAVELSVVRPRACRRRTLQRSSPMKRLIAFSGITLAMCIATPPALAQALPPPLPQLTPEQSSNVEQRIDRYRQQTDARVARGEITADEADRLVRWREWQLAEQAAGFAPSRAPMVYDSPPPDYRGPASSDAYVVAPPPYYEPYYRYAVPYPYYRAPAPYYYWGPAICAGGFGRHFGGRICF
jgi:hypothetical protein